MLLIELTSTQSKLDTKHSTGSVVSALAVRALEKALTKQQKSTMKPGALSQKAHSSAMLRMILQP